MHGLWPWFVVFLLGCYHGLNPGMGWLFAVALGLQEKSVRAVFATVPPIALGHAASIGAIVVLTGVLAWHLPSGALRLGAAALLIGFGAYGLVRRRHPRWVGMRVGFGGLVLWGFVIATGHGAGLMLLPIISPGASMPGMAMPDVDGLATAANPSLWLPIISVHTLGYVLIMTLVALLVYQKLGLAILRRGWFNLDLLWAATLVAAGIVMLVVYHGV